ncbi:hypothetical protein ACET3Z_008478 [Daucus carota]
MGHLEELQDPRIQYYQSYTEFSIEDYYIAAVKSSDGSNLNQSIIYFKLNLNNDDEATGVYYDNFNLTFSYYTTEGDIVPVANYTIPGFRQGREAETDRKGYVVTPRGITWQEISNVSVSSDVVVFRVDLASAVRFRHYITGIKSKRLRTMAWCNVEVDRITGKKKSNKAIRLKHVVIRHPSAWIIFAFVIVLLSTLVVPSLVWICFGVIVKCCRDI